MATIKIELLAKDTTYTRDSMISGRLKCYFNSGCTLKSIVLKLECLEESYVDKSKKNPKNYNSKISLEIATKIITYERVAKEGTSYYPFEIHLPEEIPCSLNIPNFGSISYSLQAELQTSCTEPGFVKDYRKITIDSKNVFLSSHDQIYLEPFGDLVEKTTSCLSCLPNYNKTSIKLEVKFKNRAFIFGDMIKFKLTLYNQSRKCVKKILVSTQAAIIYKSENVKNVLIDFGQSVTIFDGSLVEEIKSFDVEVKAAEGDVPNLFGSVFFRFEYVVVTQVFVKWGRVVKVEVPVVLGDAMVKTEHVITRRKTLHDVVWV